MATKLISLFSVAGDEFITWVTWVISPVRGVVEHRTPDLSLISTGFTLQLVSLGALDLLSLTFFHWTLTWEQHHNSPPNAEEELPAAVPVLPLWAELLRSLPKQARARVAPQPDGAIGSRKEWRFQRIPEGQEGLGVEPVLCAWGVHGLGPTIRWKGTKCFDQE